METKTPNKYLLIWILKCWNYIINFYGVEELVQLIIFHQSTVAEEPCVKPEDLRLLTVQTVKQKHLNKAAELSLSTGTRCTYRAPSILLV